MQPLSNLSFVITRLVIYPQTSRALLKNLRVEDDAVEYLFTSDCLSAFFGNNITIQTIVGENGAGKSSLIDVIIRMVNNFGAMLYRATQYLMDQPLRYVKDIYADLDYYLSGKKGVLRCRGKAIALKYDDVEYAFGQDCQKVFEGCRMCDVTNDNDVREIASRFFYTIVTNYSLQSYISDDYRVEGCMKYMPEKRCWCDDPYGSWIDSLFHKNDGYMCPVNLNPYRDGGIIDMSVETDLTRSRIAALMVHTEKQRGKRPIDESPEYSLIEGYELEDIEYTPDYDKVLQWFDGVSPEETLVQKSKRIIGMFQIAYRTSGSPSYMILQTFRLPKEGDADDDILWFARLYLVVKVLAIAAKYPVYRKYRAIGKPGYALDPATDSNLKVLFKHLAKEVKDDTSHIGVKVTQACRFLKRYGMMATHLRLDEPFSYADYEKYVRYSNDRDTPGEILRRMPPPIFSRRILLRNSSGAQMPFTQLSSGERQFLFTISAVIYHILNLRSVDETKRPKYRGINVVFDEAELCFHPEYQRTFINKLLRVLKSLCIPSDCSLNIILTTHSPFLLSDIPADHVLYLKDGAPYHTERNPFAANVCDILRNSFFLDNGFIGAYAQKKIEGLIRFFTSDDGKRGSYDMTMADRLIDMIGDPLLRSHLHHMRRLFIAKFPHADTGQSDIERLRMLRKEVARLEKKIKDEKDTD